jgi:hypothetical protein
MKVCAAGYALTHVTILKLQLRLSQSENQSYFMTGGLPPICLSCRQAP